MPELPEVEVVRRGLQTQVVGATIARVTDVHPRAVLGMTGRQLGAQVRGARFEAIGRHGKYLLCHLSNGRTIIAHLRMSGKFRVIGAADSPVPYTRARLHLADGRSLCYADVRTLGNMRVVATDQLAGDPSLGILGIDALDPDFTSGYLRERVRASRRQLKVFLLDQSNFAGVGNIYASEICFLVGASPFRRTNRLIRAETERLDCAIVDELTAAVEHGGTTFDVNSPHLYLDANGQPGRHADCLRVYQRHGLPCRSCGDTIRRKVQQQRGTFYCPKCQR